MSFIKQNKKALIVLGIAALLALGLWGVIGYEYWQDNKVTNGKSEQSTSEDQGIVDQLADVKQKISELPELEEDIFTKCMEGKQPSAEMIKACQESTQSSIFTLSQDLNNLKKSLEEQLQN